MTLTERLNADFLTAAKARDEFAVANLRMLKSSLKNAQIEKMADLAEADVEKVLVGEAKKLRDAMTMYKEGGRADLVAQTEKELAFIEGYLPKALSDDELRAMVTDLKAKLGVQSASDFGKLMGAVMQAAGSRADGTKVKAMVQEALK
jgi:uncharacterized protein YqeY